MSITSLRMLFTKVGSLSLLNTIRLEESTNSSSEFPLEVQSGLPQRLVVASLPVSIEHC